MIVDGFKQISQKAAIEGIVLLKNTEGILPIKNNEMVSLFGRSQIDYYKSGTGSGGAVNVLYSVNALEGLRNEKVLINEELVSIYKEYIKSSPFDNGGGGWAQEPWFQKELMLTKDMVESAAKKSKKAIIFIGRTAGEDKDNVLEQGSYYLTDIEKNMIEKVSNSFKDVVIVFNVGNIIDMSYIETLGDKIKSIVYAWHGGQEGGNALAKVLSGNETPSGKLVDTIARKVSDYPSNANFGNKFKNLYVEDIYVGYRFFETFQRDAVLFPFGFGLSYTSFKTKVVEYKKTEQEINLKFLVCNTGTSKGQEVIQMYCEAPQGKLGKPFVELIGFGKTTSLYPGDSQEITISIPLYRIASYDDGGYTGHKSAYVLEEGNYKIYYGNHVRDLNLAFSFELDALVVVEQLQESLAPITAFERMVPGIRKSSGEYEIAYQKVPTRTVDLAQRVKSRLPKNITYKGPLGITLQDVRSQRNTVEDFISQLSIEEMALIIRGEGMSHPLVTPGTAAAFGGTYRELREYGIPTACCADGPSGVRMDDGEVATQMPIGSLLACTWNIELMEELYEFEGKELLLNKVDTLLGPGLNIHRHPLNGRNFEYFSEDPLLSGLFSKASIVGMHKSGTEGTLKHFAANDQEKQRNHIDAVASERCLREIHLKGFEIAVKEGNARSIMTAYNPINGIQSASNYDLNTTILRNEWGFEGIVMTDWWAIMNDNETGGIASRKNTSFMLRAQNDLYMVVPTHGAKKNQQNDNTVHAIETEELTTGELQRSVINILNFILNAPVMDRPFEKVRTTEVTHSSTTEEVVPVEGDIVFQTTESTYKWIEVKEEEEYYVSIETQYNDSPLAQSMLNFLMNDVYLSTIQMNGRGHKWLNQIVGYVRLVPGHYKIELLYKTPGMKVGSVKINRV